MLFNSYIFVLLFLPVSIIEYFLLNAFKQTKSAQFFLLVMSFFFYGYFNLQYLFIILLSISFNYIIYRLMKVCPSKAWDFFLLAVSTVFNLGVLFYFKYFDFFTETVNTIFHTDFVLRNLVLPLGISFFSFQQLGFIIDCFKEETPQYSFLEYALFVAYFPQLIAGPIMTHKEVIPQFSKKEKQRVDWNNLSSGLYIFSLGMAKKVLIADTFGNAANWGFGNIGELDTINAFLVMLSFTIQIYFDFSGYCDMAMGIGKMMNIDIPLNFNSPYKALTITEFWKRWHITLTRFFTHYLYIPLGGNRKGELRTYLNTFLVFLASGLWHGAGGTFILWGGVHGIFLIITKRWKKFFDHLHPALNWLLTFGFVNFTWVIFRAKSLRDSLRIFYRMAELQFNGINPELVSFFNLPEFRILNLTGFHILDHYKYFYFVGFFMLAFLFILGAKNSYEKMMTFSPTLCKSMTTAVLLVWCIFSFSGVSTFLYFNF